MSPEQARGKELDSRTDLFPSDCPVRNVYGRTPFRGETSAVIFQGILVAHQPPQCRLNPELPLELNNHQSCVEKDKNLRYQHAAA